MKSREPENNRPDLNSEMNEIKRFQALLKRCNQYRLDLKKQKIDDVARQAAMGIKSGDDDTRIIFGDHFLDSYNISWPDLTVTDSNGKPAAIQTEALWLHYLNRADGHPLTRRWVNLSEIGGLFYQQAFQGYCGDMLAEAWQNDIEGLRKTCLAAGGWEISGLGDLAYEWRALPRLPVCLCYRQSVETGNPWATILFDASANHYVAADVAAITGKQLADRLMPKK